MLLVIPSFLRESSHWIWDGESLMERGFKGFKVFGNAHLRV